MTSPARAFEVTPHKTQLWPLANPNSVINLHGNPLRKRKVAAVRLNLAERISFQLQLAQSLPHAIIATRGRTAAFAITVLLALPLVLGAQATPVYQLAAAGKCAGESGTCLTPRHT